MNINSFTFKDSPELTRLPGIVDRSSNWTGNLSMIDCPNLTNLALELLVNGDLVVSGCHSLTSFTLGRVVVNGNVSITECNNLKELAYRLTVNGNLIIERCASLVTIGSNSVIAGDLIIDSCSRLLGLPQYVTIHRNLILRSCSEEFSIPRGAVIGGNVLRGYPPNESDTESSVKKTTNTDSDDQCYTR